MKRPEQTVTKKEGLLIVAIWKERQDSDGVLANVFYGANSSISFSGDETLTGKFTAPSLQAHYAEDLRTLIHQLNDIANDIVDPAGPKEKQLMREASEEDRERFSDLLNLSQDRESMATHLADQVAYGQDP